MRFAAGDFAGDAACELPEGAAGGTGESTVAIGAADRTGVSGASDASVLAVAEGAAVGTGVESIVVAVGAAGCGPPVSCRCFLITSINE